MIGLLPFFAATAGATAGDDSVGALSALAMNNLDLYE
jgi:hypothetical protein